MHYALLPEQKKYFQHNGAIAFEKLWDDQELESVCGALWTVLAMRLSAPVSRIGHHSSQQRYLVGRDIWRGSSLLKKAITSPALAGLAAELLDKTPLRLAYDQFLPEWQPLQHHEGAEQAHYSNLLKRRLSLADTSSIQGIVGGLIICLEAPLLTLEEPSPEMDSVIWPLKAGSGVFFNGTVPIDFRVLAKRYGTNYLLIAYCRENSVYVMQNNDPQVHALKYVGYNFGDRLNDKLNPIVFR